MGKYDINGMKEDIFDKVMHLPVLNVLEPFYSRHKEILLYLFFGGLAFFLNLGLFTLIDTMGMINELVNNMICWIICVLFQFFTNRTWVFDGQADSTAEFIKQMSGFVEGRAATLLIEELILAVFITWLQMNALIVKLAAQVVVIILNYVISKLVVFKK